MRCPRVVLLLVSIGMSAQGQGGAVQPHRVTAWAFAGPGVGKWADTALYAGSLGFVVQRAHVLGMVRAVTVEHPENAKEIQEFGALVGLASQPGVFHAGAAIGLGVSNSTQPDNGNVFAIPVEVMLGVRALPFVGFSMRGFGSISSIGPFSGLVVTLDVGRLR